LPKRQVLIVRMPESDGNDGDHVNPAGSMESLGERAEIYRKLADQNISPEITDGEFLYGPGITIQAPMTGQSDVMQLLCSIVDEDIAWPVLMRLCPRYGWSLMDPESGRVLHLG